MFVCYSRTLTISRDEKGRKVANAFRKWLRKHKINYREYPSGDSTVFIWTAKN